MAGKIRVAVNGYGVIGKRVADAVALQNDMELVGMADIGSDYRVRALAGRESDGTASIESTDRSLGIASSFLPAISRPLTYVTGPAVEHRGMQAVRARHAEFRGVGFKGAEEPTG